MIRSTVSGFCAVAVLLVMSGLGGQSAARGADMTIEWPNEWVVFGPLHRLQPVVGAEVLRSVPATIRVQGTDNVPGQTLKGRRLRVKPGEPADLSGVLGDSEDGNAAYVFLELGSPAAQEVTLGMGADWWLQAWLNGRPVFDTLEGGNAKWPIGILNHKVKVRLRQGGNVLAVRFIRGNASAAVALGGPAHFAAEEARLAARLEKRRLNVRPKALAGRLCFPVEEQAVATAKRSIVFPTPDAELEQGGLAGLRRMPARQLYLDTPKGAKPEILDTVDRRFAEPVVLLLSKFQYPWEDRHLDAIVWTTPSETRRLRGSLEVLLKDVAGAVLARHEIADLSPTGLFFSVGFPGALKGRKGALEVVWRQDGRVVGRSKMGFEVTGQSDVSRSGRIPLRVLNEPAARIAGAPMTVGVPFPRGALDDEANVRLADENGTELPLQTRTTARWSRFGPVKWLLCDFTADVDRAPRTLFLEYGPRVRRKTKEPMTVVTAETGFPSLNAGRIRISEKGLSFGPLGKGAHQPVLAPSALLGAFVRHENGTLFGVPANVKHVVEELGSEKAVVRRTGWYVDAGSGERFCQFVTRFVFHRDSPVVRIFHTWIFTGNGNRDRIRDMGWRFAASSGLRPEGFLTSFTAGEWASGDCLVQFDYQKFTVKGGEARDGRTPGVLSARIGDCLVLFGVKDFWQNFPSELEFQDDGFAFYNWPRHNPPASFERPVTPSKAFLLRSAHEGQLLDFRLPDEYAEDPIWIPACRREKHWAKGRPETANAQGIARTEEMFLYFTDPSTTPGRAARVMQGLNDETLRAIVDPKWVAASGVYGDIHHRDVDEYPEDEHIYEQVVHAPARWNERLGFYGMWLYGDVPAWNINLPGKTVSLYRTLRKRHHGWPVGWLPFARSGDPRLLKYAEASTRQQSDACFCHYATEDVDASVGPDHFRSQGWWLRGLLPWAGKYGPQTRGYTVDSDFLWDAYYLTGYARARDVALLWGELTQHGYATTRGPRASTSMRTSYLDMYKATFEPWFLAAAHEIAKLHLNLYDRDEVVDKLTHRTIGHFWRASEIDFHRYAGGDKYRRLALNNCISWSSPRSYSGGGLWPRLSLPLIMQSAYAHRLTGDEFHLARVAAYLDWARTGVYDGDLEYGRGSIVQAGTARGIFTGYYIRHFPFALAAFERAGRRPDPVPNPFFIMGTEVGKDRKKYYEFAQPEVIIRKSKREKICLMLHSQSRAEDVAYSYHVEAPVDDANLSGTWRLGAPKMVDIPAGAPEGNYRLRVTGKIPLPGEPSQDSRIRRRHSLTIVPVAAPDVPEVIAFPRGKEGTQVASGHYEIQYWFMVPRDVEEFWIEFPIGRGGLNRISLWNPGGDRVWDRSYYETERIPPVRVPVSVPPEHRGKPWRATGSHFLIDPRIPPYFSVSRAKWFDPEE